MGSIALRVILLFVVLFSVSFSNCEDLQVGTSVGNEVGYVEQVKLSSVPLSTRTKNVFYTDEKNRVIKGISAIDIDNSSASATVTSGGVGYTYANVRLKSKRGDALNYLVQFFV